MINKLQRYVFIDSDVKNRTDIITALSSDEKNWYVSDAKDYSDFNSVLKNSGNVESCLILSEKTDSYKKMILSNNIIDTKDKSVENIVKEMHWIMKDVKNEPKTFFISDTHFSHGNIIKYCNRPWNDGVDQDGNMIITEKNIEDMNNEMINNWNKVVSENDVVYHLGDFALGNRKRIPEFVSKLNGSIRLVLGNHDIIRLKNHDLYRDIVDFFYKSGFDRVYDKPVVLDNFMIISHEPMTFVKEPFFNIFGHVHDTDSYKTISKNGCCVCVERWNYTPVSMDTIKEMYDNL